MPHEDANANGASTDSKIVPFAVDTLGNFCSISIILLKALAKVKFSKTLGSKKFRELAASAWVNTTCRDIQTAVIKTCAYTNRYVLKCAFGEEYNELYLSSGSFFNFHSLSLPLARSLPVLTIAFIP